MKTRLPKILLLWILASVFTISCSSDDDNDLMQNTDFDQLFDKWWFDEANFTADIYFSSDNKYKQKITLLGNDIIGEGDWKWYDQDAGIIEVVNLVGEGQLVSGGLYKISSLTASSFNLEISLDGGENYLDSRVYKDTDD